MDITNRLKIHMQKELDILITAFDRNLKELDENREALKQILIDDVMKQVVPELQRKLNLPDQLEGNLPIQKHSPLLEPHNAEDQLGGILPLQQHIQLLEPPNAEGANANNYSYSGGDRSWHWSEFSSKEVSSNFQSYNSVTDSLNRTRFDMMKFVLSVAPTSLNTNGSDAMVTPELSNRAFEGNTVTPNLGSPIASPELSNRAFEGNSVTPNLGSRFCGTVYARKRQRTVPSVGIFAGARLMITHSELMLMEYIYSQSIELKVLRRGDGLKEDCSVFNRLKGEEFLGDEIIDAFCDLSREEKCTTWFLSPFFTGQCLIYSGLGKLEDFARTAYLKWRKQFTSDLISCDKIFLPLNDEGGMHWFLAVLLVKQKIVEIWDSLPNRENEREAIVDTVLKGIHLTHSFTNLQESNPKIVEFAKVRPLFVPRQPNAVDCGVFVIQFMENHGNGYIQEKWDSANQRASLFFRLLKHRNNEALPEIMAAIEGAQNR